MTHISVYARTQRIVVDPASSAVAVINMGPQGPIGGAFSYVKSDGSVPMTGDLVLAGDPNSALEAAPKQYVDTGLAGKVDVSGDLFRSATVSLNDDQACYLEFSSLAIACALMAITNTISGGMATIHFRATGAADAGAAILAQVGPTWAVSAGVALTGTTGVDGQYTVRATNSGGNFRLYIENRTGGTRVFSFVLFGPNQTFTVNLV